MEENVDGTGLAVNKEVRLLCLSAISSANYIKYIQHGFFLDDLSCVCGSNLSSTLCGWKFSCK